MVGLEMSKQQLDIFSMAPEPIFPELTESEIEEVNIGIKALKKYTGQ